MTSTPHTDHEPEDCTYPNGCTGCLPYATACRAAATEQGLDPITEALDAAGLDYDIEQTGGWVMVVEIDGADGGYMAITPDQIDGSGFAVAYVSAAASKGDAEEELRTEQATAAAAVEIVQEWLDWLASTPA